MFDDQTDTLEISNSTYSDLTGGSLAEGSFVALVLLWSADQPWRAGERFLLPRRPVRRPYLIGRGAARPEDRAPRLSLVQHQPENLTLQPPLGLSTLSREQMLLQMQADGSLLLQNIGRSELLVAGRQVLPGEETSVAFGAEVELPGQLLFLCMPHVMPSVFPSAEPMVFGQPDAFGLVGESAALWALRRQLALMGPLAGHVLIRGASGTGKELAAHALHGLSPRRSQPLVARNAATLPESLAVAEFFGSARNYPQAGMPERPGLIGAAHRSTLFLDEFGELPEALQSQLLRVMDAGEYQRLGETRLLQADVRIVAATNREETSLKHDVLARFRHRLMMPDLNERKDDIPLLSAHLLRQMALQAPGLVAIEGQEQWPRISLRLMKMLVQHVYTAHVRELEWLLWESVRAAPGGVLDVPPVRVQGRAARLASESMLVPAPEARREGARVGVETRPLVVVMPPTGQETESVAENVEVAQNSALLAILTASEQQLLSLVLTHQLNMTAVGQDPASPVKRVTADVHLRVLLFKALHVSGGELVQAVRLLAPLHPALHERLEVRMRTSLEHLRQRVQEEAPESLRARLSKLYGAGFRWVEPWLERLREASAFSGTELERGGNGLTEV
ncbi:MAG: sigma 54-interacting transcriptional regulator [Myxococcota bacterium]